MKTSMFLGALAALPSLISAYSTHIDLYARDAEEDYDTMLSIRDAIPAPSLYEESYDLAMRSLEARFVDTASSIAHAFAKRVAEDDASFSEGRLAVRTHYKDSERLHSQAKKDYKSAVKNPASTHDDKAKAAGRAQGHAQDVVNGRTAAFKAYGDNDPGHAKAITGWQNAVNKWDTKRTRHENDHAASQPRKRGLDELEFLDMLLSS